MSNIIEEQKNSKILKYNAKKVLKKLIIVFVIFVFNILTIMSTCNAEYVFGLYKIEPLTDCGELLKYKGEVVKTYYAQYSSKSYNMPVYCLDKTKQGVTKQLQYYVKAEELIKDIVLWRYIINGFPYKKVEELGCMDIREAYTATQQAIYCYIHGHDINLYEPIGEAGVRTLEAMKKIIQSSNSSIEEPVSTIVTIQGSQKAFIEDTINKEYVSKMYEVKANTYLYSYYVYLTNIEGEFKEKIDVVDINNQPKRGFKAGEKFKVLIPIEALESGGSFGIEVKAKVKEKDILYGKPDNEEYQDYAVTTQISVDVYEEIQERYSKNQASIRIIKQDQETNKRIQGVKFSILDENKQIKYDNMETNENGEIFIENLSPGIYYLHETKAKEGYEENSELIKVILGLNEELNVTVNNLKKETPKVMVDKNEDIQQLVKEEKEIPNTKTTNIQKKLPITGK